MSPAERLAVHETLARYAFALDQHDSTAPETVLAEHATWTFEIPGEPASAPSLDARRSWSSRGPRKPGSGGTT
ncbi:hypothetical protein [Amycolatopsis aidingensis]|uniref:hypothetical protein n=1 Tax=Amycolatopsis aidingensis TaxID=2842453 RepID=UPI001C0C33D2|nr:hypothetical protein [Amycolatopsis aidingensis]